MDLYEENNFIKGLALLDPEAGIFKDDQISYIQNFIAWKYFNKTADKVTDKELHKFDNHFKLKLSDLIRYPIVTLVHGIGFVGGTMSIAILTLLGKHPYPLAFGVGTAILGALALAGTFWVSHYKVEDERSERLNSPIDILSPGVKKSWNNFTGSLIELLKEYHVLDSDSRLLTLDSKYELNDYKTKLYSHLTGIPDRVKRDDIYFEDDDYDDYSFIICAREEKGQDDPPVEDFKDTRVDKLSKAINKLYSQQAGYTDHDREALLHINLLSLKDTPKDHPEPTYERVVYPFKVAPTTIEELAFVLLYTKMRVDLSKLNLKYLNPWEGEKALDLLHDSHNDQRLQGVTQQLNQLMDYLGIEDREPYNQYLEYLTEHTYEISRYDSVNQMFSSAYSSILTIQDNPDLDEDQLKAFRAKLLSNVKEAIKEGIRLVSKAKQSAINKITDDLAEQEIIKSSYQKEGVEK